MHVLFHHTAIEHKMNMALQNFAHGATHYCKFKRTALCENDLHYDNKITINKQILCRFQKFFFQRSKNRNTPFYLQMFCALPGRSLSWNTPVFSRFTPREHANLIGCHFFHTHVLPHHSKVQLLRYCGKRSFLRIAKSWQVTLDRVPWFGRHVENLGDVIIYPVLGVARTGNGKKGTSGRNLILGLLLPRLLVLFSNAQNGYKHWFACFVAKSQRSIICGLLLMESRKGFDVLLWWHHVQHGRNLPWRCSKAKNEVGNHPSHEIGQDCVRLFNIRQNYGGAFSTSYSNIRILFSWKEGFSFT